MSDTDAVAHDPSAPAGHLPGFAREERRWAFSYARADGRVTPYRSAFRFM